MKRLLLLPLLVAPLVLVGGGPAAGDCAGPVIEVAPDSGSPGTALVVTGRYWGTDCYDTGPPPPGQGVLGLPDTDIEVTFVDAAGNRTPLGTVDADGEYEIRLDAAVPDRAVDGPAQVEAVSSTGFLVTPAPFAVGDGVVPAAPPFTG